MKKLLFLCLFALFSLLSSAQFREVYPQPDKIKDHPAYRQMEEAYKSNNLQQTIALASALIERYPLEQAPYQYMANVLYVSKQYKEAYNYYNVAFALNPMQTSTLINVVMAAMYANQPAAIREPFLAISILPNTGGFENAIENLLQTFSSYSAYSQVTQSVREALQWHRQNHAANGRFYNSTGLLIDTLSMKKVPQRQPDSLFNAVQQLKSRRAEKMYPDNAYFYQLGTLGFYSRKYNPELLRKLLPDIHAALAEKGISPFAKFFLYNQMVQYFSDVQDYESVVTISNIMASDMKGYAMALPLYSKVILNITEAFLVKKDINQAKEYGETLSGLIPKIKEQDTKAKAYNVAATILSYTDKASAARLFDEGISYTKMAGCSNTFIEGMVTNRESFINQTAPSAAGTGWKDNVTVVENQAILLINQQKYREAIPYLKQAKQILEKEMAATSLQKYRGLLTPYARICNYLIGSVAHVYGAEEVLPIMEDVKGFSLAEITSKDRKRATIKEIQAVLKSNEALVYYVDISSELNDGFYIAVVLTREKARLGFSFAHNSFLPNIYAGFNKEIGMIEQELARKEFRTPVYTKYNSQEEGKGKVLNQGEMGLLIEFYRRKLNPSYQEMQSGAYNPNLSKAMGRAFHNALLEMFEEELKGKTHLVFALDGELNYLPFETLVTKDQQYLVQKYDISYIASGTVLANLRKRKPYSYSRSVLAFGDAKYSVREATGYPLKSQDDVERVRLKVEESIGKGLHLDEAFATFSKTAASYLEGTKKEVEAIRTIVPDAVTFMDQRMNENEFKKLNNAGELANYRIIHIASHAGVHPYVFDLSGIMFSVYPRPLGNEDGELVISEVSKLRMNPELVMLSACQTGLGKLVPGDGVAGLNHAFLSAGANATITSLWNVNDYATMLLTSGLYHKVFKENKEYVKALCEIKREFINSSNELLKSPGAWAPFIYTGK